MPRALKDIHENGIHGDLQPMTREVIDTFRAIGSIQKRYGKKMAHRYIISFTKSAQHVADVFELAHLSFAHEEDVPELDVIPLFEQLEDLEGCVDVLDQMLTLPVVQKRLAQTNRRMELRWAIPTLPRMPVLPRPCSRCTFAQERIAKWAEKNDIDLVLMHGRGGAVGRRRPGQQGRVKQPKGSSTASLSLPSRAKPILPVTATARWLSAMLSPLPPQRFCSRPRVSRRPTPRPRRSSGIWPRSSTLQATNAIWTC